MGIIQVKVPDNIYSQVGNKQVIDLEALYNIDEKYGLWKSTKVDEKVEVVLDFLKNMND